MVVVVRGVLENHGTRREAARKHRSLSRLKWSKFHPEPLFGGLGSVIRSTSRFRMT